MIPTLLLTISIILTIAGLFSYYGWWFDLAAHFRVQYFLLQLLCVLLCLPKKKWRLLCIALIAAVINLSFILPFYFPVENTNIVQQKPAQEVSIVLINVNSYNNEFERVSDYVNAMNPDILALEEINDKWINGLEDLLAQYPYKKIITRPDNFGIALFSKIESAQIDLVYYGPTRLPSILSNYQINNTPVTVVFTHTIPPISPQHYQWRNDQLNDIASHKDSFSDHLILLGDLNTTSFSNHFTQLAKSMNLTDTRLGFGLQSSWPTVLPLLWISIDHILVSKNIKVLNRMIGPHIGSDHYPVYIKLRIS